MTNKILYWDRRIREEHRDLDSQREALRAALGRPSELRDSRIRLWKMLHSFAPRLEPHLQQEEVTLFPALEQLLGPAAGLVCLLREQHTQLRAILKRLDHLLEQGSACPWESIVRTGQELVELLEAHEKNEEDFLTHQFHESTCQMYEEKSRC